MKTIPLRYLADINPPTPAFDAVSNDDEVGFLPLEAVWSDARADHARRAPKRGVATGYTRYQAGDVVSPKVTPTFQAGRSMIATTVGAGTTELHILRPRDGVDSRWVAYALRSKHFLEEGVTAFQGVAGLQRVPAEFVAAFRVVDHPVKEQRRIADFLDDRVARIDRIIAARREQQRMLARLRGQAVLNDLAGVEVLPLRRVLSYVRTGGTPPTEADSESGLPWYTPGDFDDNLAVGTPSRLVSDVAVTVFPPGSVLLVGIGATVGKVAWIDHDASGNQQITCLVPDAAAMDSRFLLHQLAARAGELRMTAPSATLPIINNETLKSLLIACPLVDEQRRLVREWDHLRDRAGSVVLSVQRSIDLLIEYKQSLITAAVTGELDVTTVRSGLPG